MAITGSELVYYASQTVNDTTSNGGRISATEWVSGSPSAPWPMIPEASLAAGLDQWRKGFVRVDNAANETATSIKVGLWKTTPGGDRTYLAEGTQTNIQSAFGTPDLYGVGQLNVSRVTGQNEIAVLVEHGATTIFRVGDLIRIHNETTDIGVGGTAEFHTIATGGVAVVGDVHTLTLETNLANNYSNTNTFVSSIIEATDVEGSTTGKTVTSTAGTFAEANMVVGNIGSIYQQLTFTFSNATTFAVTSDAGVTLPGGTISATYAPTNGSNGSAYFSVPSTCWGGTYTNGDTVVITTVPPAVPILERRIVPAGTTAFGAQNRVLMMFVES